MRGRQYHLHTIYEMFVTVCNGVVTVHICVCSFYNIFIHRYHSLIDTSRAQPRHDPTSHHIESHMQNGSMKLMLLQESEVIIIHLRCAADLCLLFLSVHGCI